MKIERITIDNYKSIKFLEIEPNAGLNAFIGENSVGKSNIFNAINWLVGPMWPTLNSTQTQDHWEGNLGNKIKIVIDYDDGQTLVLDESKKKYQFSIEKLGAFGDSQDRLEHSSAYLGIDREIQDYLPSNRWTLIGRILQQINDQFLKESVLHVDGTTEKKNEIFKSELEKIRDTVLFSVGRTAPENRDGLMDRFLEIIQRESAKQLNREESAFAIDLSLYDPWNFYRTLQLLVSEVDMGMQFQASSLGMGVQASITIAVLKAYAELNLPNKTPIFIDEPELFLHPQAQRNFYNILREMAKDVVDEETGETVKEGLQIFYTTHSPNFLRADHFNEINIVRKTRVSGTYCKGAKPLEFVSDLKKRKGIGSSEDDLFLHFRNAYENTGDSQRANEAFFAKKIILVEGQSESLIIPYFFSLYGFDYEKEGISIVRCGSKGEIDRFFRLYNEFGIPCYLIFDGDKQNDGGPDEDNTKDKNRDILGLFDVDKEWPDGTVNDRYFGFEKRLEENLGFSTSKKGLSLFLQVKKEIKEKEKLPVWVEQIIDKIESLQDPLACILK